MFENHWFCALVPLASKALKSSLTRCYIIYEIKIKILINDVLFANIYIISLTLLYCIYTTINLICSYLFTAIYQHLVQDKFYKLNLLTKKCINLSFLVPFIGPFIGEM